VSSILSASRSNACDRLIVARPRQISCHEEAISRCSELDSANFLRFASVSIVRFDDGSESRMSDDSRERATPFRRRLRGRPKKVPSKKSIPEPAPASFLLSRTRCIMRANDSESLIYSSSAEVKTEILRQIPRRNRASELFVGEKTIFKRRCLISLAGDTPNVATFLMEDISKHDVFLTRA